MSDLALPRAHPNTCVQVYDGKPWWLGMRDHSVQLMVFSKYRLVEGGFLFRTSMDKDGECEESV